MSRQFCGGVNFVKRIDKGRRPKLIEGVRGEDFAGWLAQQVGPHPTKSVLQKSISTQIRQLM